MRREWDERFPGRILEVEVERAIKRGELFGTDFHGYVFLNGHDLAARYKRVPGHVRKRPRAWLITHIEPKRIRGPKSRRGHVRVGAPGRVGVS